MRSAIPKVLYSEAALAVTLRTLSLTLLTMTLLTLGLLTLTLTLALTFRIADLQNSEPVPS